jgi:hypothetical protein
MNIVWIGVRKEPTAMMKEAHNKRKGKERAEKKKRNRAKK